MQALPRSDITGLLSAWSGGDREALDRLVPHVYAELRLLARRELAREAAGHTLDSAALVHEAYLKLVDQGNVAWQNRAHFFAIAARTMRGILIDHARARRAQKRGGGRSPLPLEEATALLTPEQAEELLALDEALVRLEAVDGTACRVVECRYFGGLTIEEASVALHLSVATTRRRWAFAKAWLRRELRDAG
jgi:RNA polymerase sigma-70 factor, ECF subfamily